MRIPILHTIARWHCKKLVNLFWWEWILGILTFPLMPITYVYLKWIYKNEDIEV